MKITNLLPLVALAGAHTLMTNFYVDGINQDAGTCVRMSNDNDHATDPIRPISSQEMACGVNGETAVARVCPVNGGSVLTFQFKAIPNGGNNVETIDKSHKGPCAVYMKKVDDSSDDQNAQNKAAGPGWFKVFEDGYDQTSGTWCTERLIIDTNGLMSVRLPSDLATGHYLVRSEVLALQEADKIPADPQFYVNCAQVFMSNTKGTTLPRNTVSIPGHVNMQKDNKALTFNIWSSKLALPYPQLGPSVYSSNVKRDVAARGATPQSTQTTGLKPNNCVLEVDNWCGIELIKYSGESECWNASTVCWKEATSCYDSAGPTGGDRCKLWESKCKGVQNSCDSGNFEGPPDYGKDLTPPLQQIAVPPAANDGGQRAAKSVPIASTSSLDSAAPEQAQAEQDDAKKAPDEDDDSCEDFDEGDEDDDGGDDSV